MSEILLSILIPSTPDREEDTARLLGSIQNQHEFKNGMGFKENNLDWQWMLGNGVEVLVAYDNKEMTIGEKREFMYRRAAGKYSWQIDSDDDIAYNAIELILEAIKENPDCITFEEYVNIDGNVFKSNISHTYHDWDGDGQHLFNDGFHYHRTPFFKSVIKTEIAKKVRVPQTRFGEDHEWARLLKPNLQTEVHIPQEIYKYLHTSSDFNERYGIK